MNCTSKRLSCLGFKTVLFILYQMFQVVHSEKPLYVQAGNCVEASEWLEVLGQVSRCNEERLASFHPSNYTGGAWQCCKIQSNSAAGCKPCTPWVFYHITTAWTKKCIVSCYHVVYKKKNSLKYKTSTFGSFMWVLSGARAAVTYAHSH